MKYKKYLVFIMILMLFGIKAIKAETCYYQSGDISLEYNLEEREFTIRQRENKSKILFDGEPLINADRDKSDGHTGKIIKSVDGNTCPAYVVYRRYDGILFFNNDGIWGFNNSAEAETFRQESMQSSNRMLAWSSSITNITKEEFESNIKKNVENYTTGNVNNNVNYNVGGVSTSDEQLSCEELFDPSIMELVNDVLKYPRFIVPIIILVLGTLDFFKAVMAGKEDEMKKAQKTFIKRVIIGVLVFLVPVLINAIMWIANIAWEGLGYSTCNL